MYGTFCTLSVPMTRREMAWLCPLPVAKFLNVSRNMFIAPAQRLKAGSWWFLTVLPVIYSPLSWRLSGQQAPLLSSTPKQGVLSGTL